MGTDYLNVLLRLEDDFGLPDHVLDPGEYHEPLVTVGALHEAIWNHLRISAPETRMDEGAVWQKVRRAIAEELEVDMEWVTKTSHLVTDLGAD